MRIGSARGSVIEPVIKPVIGLAIGLVTALALTGCGGGEPAGDATTGDGPEKTQLTVGIVPVPSSAPLFIAMERGFFKEEGLSVKTQTIQAPQQIMPQILNGGIDTFLTSYVSLITISDSGVARLKMLTEAQEGAPGISGVVVAGDSAIKDAAGLKDKTVAVNVVKALGEVTVSAHLKSAGLAPGDVKFVPVNFAEQLAALKAGRVDAAWMTEPYISAAKKDLGGRVVIDTLSGPTDGLPLDGWAASADWVSKNPKTAAAFQRAMAKAQQVAADDRAAINKVIPEFTQIPAEVAASMGLGTFTTSLDTARIQKVADLLAEFQITKTKHDAAQLVAAPPA
jgi:NitT/TauT family transport system substrate-binding protein